MASMPKSNRTVRIMPETKANQAWAPLLTSAGVLIDATRRSLVADVIARLMQCHLESNNNATFACVGHGIRFVSDGVSGSGSPCFVESKGAATGEIYLFGGLAKKDGLLAALGSGNVESTRDESKGGLYVTLAKDADAQRVFDVLAMHASVRGPVGYRSDMGAPQACEDVSFDPSTQPIKVAKVETATEDKPKASKKARKDKSAAA